MMVTRAQAGAARNGTSRGGESKSLDPLDSGGNRVSAEVSGRAGFSLIDIVIRPQVTFFYNYFLRGGFLDGREGLLLHLYHSNYVSWKYAKAWERSR